MKKYYIDSENVYMKWIDIARAMEDSDMMVLYVSKFTRCTPSVFIEFTDLIKTGKFIIKNVMVKGNGCNAMDYVIAADVDNDVRRSEFRKTTDSKNKYIIVSNDNGYDGFIEQWKDEGFYCIERKPVELPQEVYDKINKAILESTEKETAPVAAEKKPIAVEKKEKKPATVKTEEPKTEKEAKTTAETDAELVKKVASVLRSSVASRQGKKHSYEKNYNYEMIAKAYIKTKTFEGCLKSIGNNEYRKLFSGLVTRDTRKMIESLIK